MGDKRRASFLRWRQRSRSVKPTSQRQRAFQIEALESRMVFSTTPIITEFMASNSTSFVDGNGASSDWIEIYNPTAQAINLAGWHLTDDAGNLDKWTFPSVPQAVLDPGEYLVVFASNQPTETFIDSLGYMHTDFSLNAEGEYLALTNPLETVIHAYSPEFPRQISSVSYGLVQNAQSVTLIDDTNTAAAIVPTNGSLDSASVSIPPAWTTRTFNDTGWLRPSSGVGVGFDSGDDAIVNVPNGTVLPGGLLGFDLTDPDESGGPNGIFSAGGSSPGNESPAQALDNSTGSKWLAFTPSGTWYQFQFSGGNREVVNGYTITSANDASDRDPYSWTLSGSNDGVNFTVIDTRNAQNFTSRLQTRLYEFNNNLSFEYYRFNFQTEFGVTGHNRPNSIQLAEIELLSSGSVDYTSAIDLNLSAAYATPKTSVYQRIPFNVADPSVLSTLTLSMKYDDGFVAYLNGTRVASAFAPTLPTFQSNATGERDDADSTVAQDFNLTQFLSLLVPGNNVLAIHVLNVSDSSLDLLSVPELTATEVLDSEAVIAYMPVPTPGAENAYDGVSLGPLVSEVTENPPQPTDNQDIPITARISAQGSPVATAQLHYRVMYGPESTVVMLDNGLGSDLLAGDGIYTAVIPAAASSAGQMVRWYVTATDTVNDSTRYPLFLKPTASPEYLGTVIAPVGVTTALPVFEYFVENVSASATETGTRGQVYYLGEFYDNVFVRRRGGNTTQGRKFEFNDGHHFRFNADEPRVDEINLNERGAESTYMRQVLSWELYDLAGVPASQSELWYTRLNGNYLDVRVLVEQPDGDLLESENLDSRGALYKIGADGVENSVTSSTNGVKKRTRTWEDNSDLQALVNGVSPSNPNRATYVYDNIDIASALNYIAATSIIHDNDHPHKNYHLYRDTEGSEQWTFLPWDKDLTFGLNFGIGGVIGDVDPFGHPFFGDVNHQKIDNQWNRMIDSLFAVPQIREMYLRRLRTLMDQFLLAPGQTGSWLETRVAELTAVLSPHVGGANWLNEVNRITGEYLTERRQHLYVNHAADGPAYPDKAGIPAAQVGNPPIQFGTVDANPVSGNQDQEYIQLYNPNTTAVDISLWKITGAIEYRFHAGTVIPAGGSLYIAADVPSFLARTTGPRGGQQLFVQGNYEGRLSSFGGALQLDAADGQLIAQTTFAGTEVPLQGRVVLSEVQYHPVDPPVGSTITALQLEFVEIHNRKSTALDLTGWQLSEGVTYNFPANATVPAYGTVLVVPIDPSNTALVAEFRAFYGIDSSVTLLGPYSGQLSNSGEAVSLLAPGVTVGSTIIIDRINYNDAAPWPTGADGGGQSISRARPTALGELSTSWYGNAPSPGVANYPLPPGDFDANGVVEQADYSVWLAGFGSMTNLDADGNHDGLVDGADYTLWRDNLGATLTLPAALNVAAELGLAVESGSSAAPVAAAVVANSNVSDTATAAMILAVDSADPVSTEPSRKAYRPETVDLRSVAAARDLALAELPARQRFQVRGELLGAATPVSQSATDSGLAEFSPTDRLGLRASVRRRLAE